MLASGADVLVATPGRLIDFIDNDAVRLDAVRSVVLDEADHMADMGFLPAGRVALASHHCAHQTLLFSATLDGAVDHVVRRHLKDPVFHEVLSTTVTVDEMAHRFVLVHQLDKVKVAAAITQNVTRSLVFVRTKRGADRLVEQLEKEGVPAAAIHGDLRQAMREKSLAAFSAGKLPVLVATDVAARGIHVDDIDVVVHYDPPEEAKTYLHRSGRHHPGRGVLGLVVTLGPLGSGARGAAVRRRLGLRRPDRRDAVDESRLPDLAAARDPTDAPVPRAAACRPMSGLAR